jgi:phenylacetate-coenzyme A ligase PaaK-like adenylate-forming protein
LLDEVKAGECYEIVITNFHGGSMVRYRIGDMIRITSLHNDNLGIDIPQMEFERRSDDLLDFTTVRLSEKTIWKAIEKAGVPYQDWIAYKNPGESTLNLLIEPQKGYRIDEREMAQTLCDTIFKEEKEPFGITRRNKDAFSSTEFKIKITALSCGAFAQYASLRRSEGADIAHIKPPHVNPPKRILALFLNDFTVAPGPVINAAPTREKDLVR